MAYKCACGYSTQKGGKAVERHEQRCGRHHSATQKVWKGDAAGAFKKTPKK